MMDFRDQIRALQTERERQAASLATAEAELGKAHDNLAYRQRERDQWSDRVDATSRAIELLQIEMQKERGLG